MVMRNYWLLGGIVRSGDLLDGLESVGNTPGPSSPEAKSFLMFLPPLNVCVTQGLGREGRENLVPFVKVE